MWGRRALVAALLLHLSAAAVAPLEALARAATGGRASRAVVRETRDRGRGLFASERLRRGELVFRVPKERMICADTVTHHPVLGPALEAMARATGPDGRAFALYAGFAAFIEEQGQSGPAWQRKYVQSLPSVDHPMLWSHAELSRLNGTSLLRFVRWAKKRAYAYWRTLPLFQRRRPVLKEQDFRRRMVQVMSRLFAIDFSGVERFRRPDGTVGVRGPAGTIVPAQSLSSTMPCLVPLADMINHDSTPRGAFGEGGNIHHVYRPASGLLEFRALARVEAGEELVRSYGQSSPSEMVMTYGFLPPPGQRAERVAVRLGAPRVRGAGMDLRLGLSRATIRGILRASGTEIVLQPRGVSAEGASALRARALLTLAPKRPISAHDLASALGGQPGSIALERASLRLLRWVAHRMVENLEGRRRANAKAQTTPRGRAALADGVIRAELRIFSAVARSVEGRLQSGVAHGRSEDAVQPQGGLLPVLGR